MPSMAAAGDHAYDFQPDTEEEDQQQLGASIADAVRRLKGVKAKDGLIKGLKQLLGILERVPQEVAVLGRAKGELAKLLGSITCHADKDVKLYAAACHAQQMRIYAPDTPYEDEQLQVGAERSSARVLLPA